MIFSAVTPPASSAKPRVLLLINCWNWAFHTIANALEEHLGDRYSFTILCTDDKPVINESLFDIIHVFYELETYHRNFLHGKAKVVKGVYSHYWQLQGLDADAFYEKFLWEAHAITVPSLKLFDLLDGIPCPVHLFSEGVDTKTFKQLEGVQREQSVVWAGTDIPIKRLDIIRDACDDLLPLYTAIGRQYPQEEMAEFFSKATIVACSSLAEGCPRPILEGMACGAFPVSTDVGIVREMIEHTKNGYIVEEATPEAFRNAFIWCMDHPDIVARARAHNRAIIVANRQWKSTVQPIADLYDSLLDL